MDNNSSADVKVCPLRGIAAGSECPCIGPRCAWWHEYPNYSRDPQPWRGCCALAAIADFNR